MVLAPSEGFIPSELWLQVRKKIIANQNYQPARKARHSWMAGKIKCGKCGYALMAANIYGYLYFQCSVHKDNRFCSGCGTIRVRDLENVVYQQMVKKLEDYKTLTGRKKKKAASPKLTAKQMELAQVESEIGKPTFCLFLCPLLCSFVLYRPSSKTSMALRHNHFKKKSSSKTLFP